MTEAVVAVQVPKAAELVAAQLRRQIITGERAEGEMLPPEVDLTAELGVSRPTLRQALRILETELLITVQRGRRGGTRVNRPSPEVAGRYLGNVLLFQGATLDDVHMARLLMEPAAVAELAGTITPDQLAELRELVMASREESDPVRIRAVGGSFHTALVGMTGNPAVTLFAQLVQQLIDAHTARYENQRQRVKEPSRAGELLSAHDRVLDLLEAGAAQEAARRWREHIEEVHTLLGRTLDTTNVLDLEL
jgi:GntR family transcriptional repressor for pyruvate dehydrogenase complex